MIKATLANRKQETSASQVRSDVLQQYATEQASSFLESRELLRASTSNFCDWLILPHPCPRLAAVCGAQSAALHAQGLVTSHAEETWQRRHVGIRCAPSIKRKSKPKPACIIEGCVCQGWRRQLYSNVQFVLKNVPKDFLCNGRLVFRIDKIINVHNEVEGQDAVYFTLTSEWWHVSYVCLKPWRPVVVALQPVNHLADPIDFDLAEETEFAKPLSQDNNPHVIPLQHLIAALDPDSAYAITLYTICSTMTPMVVLRGHVRISKMKPSQHVWPSVPSASKSTSTSTRVPSSTQAPTSVSSSQPSTSHAPEQPGWGIFAEESAHDTGIDGEDSDVLSEGNDALLHELMEAAMPLPQGSIDQPHQRPSQHEQPDACPESSSSSPEEAEVVQASRQASSSTITRLVRPETIADWYGFRLTWVPPKASNKHGAWQGTCPYHRKARTGTKCKKTLTVSSSSPESIASSLLRVKAWCVLAAACNTYTDHMKSLPVISPNDDETSINNKAETLHASRQDKVVLRDDQLANVR